MENMDFKVSKKKILVACEESQRVCEAFRKLGYEAYSCGTTPLKTIANRKNRELTTQADILRKICCDEIMSCVHNRE